VTVQLRKHASKHDHCGQGYWQRNLTGVPSPYFQSDFPKTERAPEKKGRTGPRLGYLQKTSRRVARWFQLALRVAGPGPAEPMIKIKFRTIASGSDPDSRTTGKAFSSRKKN